MSGTVDGDQAGQQEPAVAIRELRRLKGAQLRLTTFAPQVGGVPLHLYFEPLSRTYWDALGGHFLTRREARQLGYSGAILEAAVQAPPLRVNR